MLKNPFLHKAAAILLLFTISACAQPSANAILLEPLGNNLTSPPVITRILAPSAVQNAVKVGDKIIAVDETRVKTIEEFYDVQDRYEKESKRATNYTIINSAGKKEIIQANKIYDFAEKSMLVSLMNQGTTYVIALDKTITPQKAATLLTEQAKIVAFGQIWESNPHYIEVYVIVRSLYNRKDANLEAISVIDNSTNGYLEQVSTIEVASIIYPDFGSAGEQVEIPAPQITGYNAFSSTNGNLNAQSFGNNIYGNYSATTNTTLTPVYDYSNQTAASMHNLGVSIQESKIKAQNEARGEFMASRMDNLKFGLVNENETRIGCMFYRVPFASASEFSVEVKLNGRKYLLPFTVQNKPTI